MIPRARVFRSSSPFSPLAQEVSLDWGWERGRQKLFFLPAPHTDFIFSIIGEEMGLVGAMVVVLLFFIFTLRGMQIGYSVEDRFGSYLALGLTLMISLQARDQYGSGAGASPDKGIDPSLHQLWRNILDHQPGRGGDPSPPFNRLGNGNEVRDCRRRNRGSPLSRHCHCRGVYREGSGE